MLDAAEEVEIVRLAVARDAQAWARLVTEFQGLVLKIAWGILGEQTAVEDAAQNAFVKIFSHLAGFDPLKGRLGAWISTIARNEALDLLRQRSRPHADLVGPEVLDAISAPLPPEAFEEEKAKLREAVPGCCDGLGGRIWDLHVGGARNVDISATLHLSVGTVSGYIARIRRCLIAKLKIAQQSGNDRGMSSGRQA